MEKIKLIGDKVIITEMSEKDAKEFFSNIKDPEISEYSGPYFATSIQKAEEYIKKCIVNIQKKEAYCLGVYNKKTGQLMGSIGLIKLDEENKNCEIGFWIGKNYWNMGFMTESVNLIIEYGFKKLGLHRISAFLQERNEGSKKVLEKCGFEREGLLKDTTYKNEKYFNELIYSKLNSRT